MYEYLQVIKRIAFSNTEILYIKHHSFYIFSSCFLFFQNQMYYCLNIKNKLTSKRFIKLFFHVRRLVFFFFFFFFFFFVFFFCYCCVFLLCFFMFLFFVVLFVLENTHNKNEHKLNLCI